MVLGRECTTTALPYMRTMIGTCQETGGGGGGEKLNRDGGKKREQESNCSQTRNAKEMRDAEMERKQQMQRCVDSTNIIKQSKAPLFWIPELNPHPPHSAVAF